MDLLAELHAEGLTLVLVTHDPTVAARADRLITVRDGELVADELLGTSAAAAGRTAVTPMTVPALALVALLSLPFLYILARRPVLRRLALRNAVAAAARGGARRPRLAARRRDHHRLAGRRRHDGRVDPAGRAHAPRPDRRARVRPRAAASSGSCCRRLGPAESPDVDGVLALRDDRRRRHLDRAARARGAALAARRRRLRRRATLRRRPRRDRDHRARTPASVTPRSAADLARALARRSPASRIAVHAVRDPRTLLAGRPRPAAARHRRLLARRRSRRRTTCSSRPATFELVRSAESRIACRLRGGSRSRTGRRRERRGADRRGRRRRCAPPPRRAGLDPEIYPVKQAMLDAADAVGESVHLDVHRDGELRRPRRAAAARQPLRHARRRAEDGARDGAGRRDAPRRSSSARSQPRAGSTRLPRRRSASPPASALGAGLVALSARIFATEHSRFDLFLTIEPSSLALSFADRLRGRARDDRRHEPPGQPAQHHPRDPRPRRAAAAAGGALRWLVAGGVAAAAGVALTVQGLPVARRLRAPARPDARGRRAGAARRATAPAQRAAESSPRSSSSCWGASLFALVPSATKGAERHALRRPGNRPDGGGRHPRLVRSRSG